MKNKVLINDNPKLYQKVRKNLIKDCFNHDSNSDFFEQLSLTETH